MANNSVQGMGGPHFAPYLENIAFPQSREAIVKLAQTNRAEPDMVDRLRRIPDTSYNSIEDLRKALGGEYENYGMVKKVVEPSINDIARH
jgi:hypothetical protein